MAMAVTVDFNANMVKFAGQVDRITEQMDRFAARSESAATRVRNVFSGLGIGLSVTGIAAFVKSGIDAADALSKMADRTGIAVENLQGLTHAANLSDTNIEQVAKSANILSIAIAKDAEAFKKLGITAKDPLEAFLQFSDVFSRIKDDQTRAAFGARVLGEEYANLAPLMRQGAKAIREQIKEGRELNTVTAEQAKKAAEFNDALTRLEARSVGFRSKIALGVLEPLVSIGEALDKDITKFGLLEGARRGFMDGYIDFALSDTGGGLSKELDQLNRQIAEKKLQLGRARSGEDFIGRGREVGLEREINNLLQKRSELIKKISEERRKDQPKAADKQFDAALQNLINPSGKPKDKPGKPSSTSQNAEAARIKSINDVIAALQRDIEISKLSEDQQRRMLEVFSATKNARGAEVDVITDLVSKKYDLIEADKRQNAQWEQLVEGANKYYDLRQEITQFERSNNVTTDALSNLIGKTQDQLFAGVITEDQAKTLFDTLGRAYNDGFIGPALDGTDKLSEYATQAARNMQTAFADFLFDPFQRGMDGMLEGFGNTLRRMAADAASAQIMEVVFGKGGELTGGLFGAAIKGIGSFFADGGVMTGAGPVPLKTYSVGGIANSPQLALFGEGRRPEAYVPLPDGRSIPVTVTGGGGGNTYNVSISVQSNSDSSTRLGEKIAESFVRTIARQEINSAARPGNSLNKITSFA